jgi:hypothetical protein
VRRSGEGDDPLLGCGQCGLPGHTESREVALPGRIAWDIRAHLLRCSVARKPEEHPDRERALRAREVRVRELISGVFHAESTARSRVKRRRVLQVLAGLTVNQFTACHFFPEGNPRK